MRKRVAIAWAGVLLASCAYDPPVAGDHQAPKYVADLDACREMAAKAAHQAVIRRGYLFLSYPISYRSRNAPRCGTAWWVRDTPCPESGAHGAPPSLRAFAGSLSRRA